MRPGPSRPHSVSGGAGGGGVGGGGAGAGLNTPGSNRFSVNPFDPSSGPSRVSSNRRRWTHIFPRASSGDYFQPFQFDAGGHPEHRPLAGVTRHEWTAESAVAASAASAGVDWKSLTTPALLPVTTDYFPGMQYVKKEAHLWLVIRSIIIIVVIYFRSTINIDFTLNEYVIRPEDITCELPQRPPKSKPLLTVEEVFNEMVSQRLAQGFQLVLMKKENLLASAGTPKYKSRFSPTPMILFDPRLERDSIAWLSIGHIFHRVRQTASCRNQWVPNQYRYPEFSDGLLQCFFFPTI